MKYKGKDYEMCDAWFLNVNDRIHSFNLKLPGSTNDLSVAHSYTDDLLNFYRCDDILKPLKDESLPEDYLDRWTGCGYTAPDGMHYIYYTMRNKYESQKIGVALSKDLENFEIYKNNPVLVPNKNIFAYTGKDGIKEDCRDMVVVYDDISKKYYGYFATMAKTDGRLTGVIGVAESTDLLNWSNQSIAYVPRFDGVIEVPDVYYLDGKWYLTVLTHSCFGAKGNFSDSFVQSGTIYAVADSPRGPFTEGADNVFIGGTNESGYTCRTFMYKGTRYVMYIDKSKNGWAVSLPKEVKVIQGKLRPCYTDILKELRDVKILGGLSAKTLRKQSCSVAWELGNGDACDINDGVKFKTNDYSYQGFILKSESIFNAEIECTIKLNCKESGLIIKCGDKDYVLTANTSDKSLALYNNSLDYYPVCKREYGFEKGVEYRLRTIFLEGQLEVYVDDILVMQNAFDTSEAMQFGFVVGCGESECKSFSLYNLKV